MAEPNLLKDSGPDVLSVVVDRKDVEELNFDRTLTVLRSLLQDRETVVNFRRRLDIAFFGYDNDSRELYEIDDVRNFIAQLDKKFPFWFYFLNLQSGTLVLILLSLCKYSINSDGLFAMDQADQERVFVEHGNAVSWLFEKYALDEKEHDVLATQIANYLQQRRRPPCIQ